MPFSIDILFCHFNEFGIAFIPVFQTFGMVALIKRRLALSRSPDTQAAKSLTRGGLPSVSRGDPGIAVHTDIPNDRSFRVRTKAEMVSDPLVLATMIQGWI